MKDYVLLPKDNVIEIQANKFVAELLLYEGANYDYILKSGTELDIKILKMLIDLKNTNISLNNKKDLVVPTLSLLYKQCI